MMLPAIVACSDATNAEPIPEIPEPPAGFLRFVAIDASGASVCALTADSLTYCWGAPQLNLEQDQSRPVLMSVPKLGTISVGTHQDFNLREMMCGTTATTEILCRGSASGGVVTVPGSAGYTNISVEAAICALAPGGGARCWTYTANAQQLGVSSWDGVLVGTPLVVEGGHTFRSISVGRVTTCAATTGGETFCWGTNLALQVSEDPGVPFSKLPAHVPTPVAVASVSNLELHTCALAPDGRAFCWGMAPRGRLGGGHSDLEIVDCPDVTDITTGLPADCVGHPVEVSGGIAFTSIAAGTHHTCGLDAQGRLYCWGSGTWGELGNGRSGVANWTATPTPVAGELRFRAVTAGQFFTCAIATNDATYCWGNNQVGQLGAGLPPGEGATVPQPVSTP